ncbi:MAG: IclR family transcriptional regulator [Rhodocyclaceae bacterium]|nr:IclR family transcriptional regulator [Pseudomonadota bacterium]MDQ7971496.1 IclR family transcriptional regulator [Rhodocyclaceae bacterium]MDQ8001006.1 IclR family transcriptional regulator [Pseudomonadota bacterium]MDQ8017779.1 IclR family transcriptional regulator [Pseudomonadota bacterium]
MRNDSPKEAAEGRGDGGVIAVTRALSLMEAFEVGESALTLAELSRRSGMHKTTVLRLARTLAQSNYMVQTEAGQWRLGPAAGWLGARYQAGFDVNNVVEPALHELVRLSGESASFYVREGDIRACVARVEGPQSVRHHVRIGARLPLDLGAPGRVILAFSGAQGEPYETIRTCGYHLSLGEREPDVSSVAAPVFRTGWHLLGSMCISGPSSRLTRAKLETHAKSVVAAANQLSYALAGGRSPATPPVVSRWHP